MGYIGKVPADVLIDPHLDSAAITDGTIVTADIANDAVTSAKLAANSVDSSELIDGSIDNSHLAGSIAINKTLLAVGTGLTLSTNTLNVAAAQTQITSVGTLTGLSSSDHVVLNNNKYFKVKDTAGSDIRVIGLANSNDVYVGFIDDATGTGNLYLRTSATNALTIDSSQDATFAGNVLFNGVVQLADVAQSIDFIQSGAINFDSNGDQTGRVLTIGSNRTGDSGGTTNVTFDEDGNTTFGKDIQRYASGGSAVTVSKTFQKTGTYSGDVEIVCTSNGWKSFIYDLVVIGHGGGGHWRGFAYHNAGITHGYQSISNNNGGVSAMSLSTSGQSMTFTVPLSSVTHILVEFRLSSGAGDLITTDEIAITID